LSASLGLEREWYFVVLAAAIGVLMGSVATLFILPLRWIEHWSGESLADGRVLYVMVAAAPCVGGLLAGVVIQMFGDTVRGPGVSGVMYAIYREKSRVPLRIAIRKWIASTLTIGSGGSAGAEGPIATIGATVGSNVGRWLRSNPQDTATLLGCGAAAGISSVFNAPLAGIFFVLEILLRDFSLRTFMPILIASVVSAAWTQTILGGGDPLFPVPLAFEGRAGYFTVEDIPNFVLLALVCGFAAPLFIRGVFAVDRAFGRLKAPVVVKPAVGGAMLGILGLIYLLARDGSGAPEFYGNGYHVIRELLDSSTYRVEDDGLLHPVGPLLLFLVAIAAFKMIGTCLTLGSGGVGGFFAPSLLVGAAIGGAFGTAVYAIDILPAADPANYALVGMAAMVAGTTHAPLTGIMIVYEATRSETLILPLMLVAVISVVVSRLISRDSVYSWKLTRQGVRIGAMSDLTILRRLTAEDVPLTKAITVRAGEQAQRLLDLSQKHRVGDFIVVDDAGNYEGMVGGADLRTALLEREAIPLLLVGELSRSDLPTIRPTETLDIVLDKFALHDVHSLAVLDGHGKGKALGLITRDALMRRYQQALVED
jgi:CIC family chloride channel protein